MGNYVQREWTNNYYDYPLRYNVKEKYSEEMLIISNRLTGQH
jgi:hypothetical protein